ncbi:baseplate hub and tail lysozyme [Bacillus phage vB_BceM-HSE3]|nr:baseplate hub and tail lysozyme [Bacillus phage vB_BceM-HSE3]
MSQSHVRKPGQYFTGQRNALPSMIRGIVEDNRDPLRIGRLKVRVYTLHGLPENKGVEYSYIPTDHLPWSHPISAYGGFQDGGSYIVPPVGAQVWVSFDGGDPNKPLYIGGYMTSKDSKPKDMGHDESLAGKWRTKEGLADSPEDVWMNNPTDEPCMDILYKSPKGHTIAMDNKDEEESFSFIDRIGQIFKFKAPTVKGTKRRGTATADDVESEFTYEDLKDKKAIVYLKDFSGQLIKMVSEYLKERLEFVSISKDKKRQSLAQFSSSKDSTNTMLLSEDKELGNKIYLEMNATDLTMYIVMTSNDTVVNRISVTQSGINLSSLGLVTSTSRAESLGSDSKTWNDEDDLESSSNEE